MESISSQKRSADKSDALELQVKRKMSAVSETSQHSIIGQFAAQIVSVMPNIMDARLRSHAHYEIYRSSRCALNNYLSTIHSLVTIVLDPTLPMDDQFELDYAKTADELELSGSTFIRRLPWRLQNLSNIVAGNDFPFLQEELDKVNDVYAGLQDAMNQIAQIEGGIAVVDTGY